MESPRKKLGTNLGPAPAFSVFAQAALAPAAAPLVESPPALDTEPAPSAFNAETLDATTPVVAESPLKAPVTFPKAKPNPLKVAKLPQKPQRLASTAPASRQPVPVELPSGLKRMHGTFAEPYQRKTDSTQTRQTMLTVDLELDDQFETFFRRNRRFYRTHSSLWGAAMTHFLDAQED
jgi:hypothetical protein